MSPEAAVVQEVEQRVAEVLGRIADAARRSGRSPADITLVGASKRQPLERIVAAVRSGVRHLGENYLQEARDKRPAIEDLLRESASPLPRWHMIGNLQRNKVRAALSLFDLVETVDRAQLAQEIDRRIGQIQQTASAGDSKAEAPAADRSRCTLRSIHTITPMPSAVPRRNATKGETSKLTSAAAGS